MHLVKWRPSNLLTNLLVSRVPLNSVLFCSFWKEMWVDVMLLPDVVLVAVYGAPYSSDTIMIIYNSISYKFLKLRPFRRLHIMCYFLLIISLYTHSQQSAQARSIFHHLKIVGTINLEWQSFILDLRSRFSLWKA